MYLVSPVLFSLFISNPNSAEIFLYKPWRPSVFFQFVSSFTRCPDRAISHFRCLKSPSFSSPFRSFASPFRCFLVSYFSLSLFRNALSQLRIALSLFRSLALSLFRSFFLSHFRCFMFLLFRTFAVSYFRSFVLSLFRTLQFRTFFVSYFRSFVLLLFCTFVVSYISYSQQTQNICITFVQRQPNANIVQMLYKCFVLTGLSFFRSFVFSLFRTFVVLL